jgi:phage terminase Nu1 subunit (DNA packaging protein)
MTYDDITQQTVTGTVLASMLGLSDMRVSQLRSEGVIQRDQQRQYPLLQSVQQYCEFLRGSSRGSDTAKAEQIERTRLAKVNADLKEKQLAELEGDLLRASVVRAQDARLATILRNNLQSIPDRLASILAAESDERTVYNAMSTEIRTSLEAVIAAMESAEVDDAQLDITRRAALAALDNEDDATEDAAEQ